MEHCSRPPISTEISASKAQNTMKRLLFLIAVLAGVAACSADDPSVPTAPVIETAASGTKAAGPADGGDFEAALSQRVKWPLVPGWDTIYGPEGRSDARFRRTCRDAQFLQRAVDRFMAAGSEWYPAHPFVDRNAADRTVIDYLPRGRPLVNTFTGQEYLPNTECSAGYPGEICYASVHWEGYSVGYVITAHGLRGEDELSIVYVDSVLIDELSGGGRSRAARPDW